MSTSRAGRHPHGGRALLTLLLSTALRVLSLLSSGCTSSDSAITDGHLHPSAWLASTLARYPAAKPLLDAARPIETSADGGMTLRSDALDARLDGDGSMSVGPSSDTRRVGVRRPNAGRARTSHADNVVVVGEASRSVDAIVFASHVIEELDLVHDAGATVGYDLTLPDGFTLRVSADGRAVDVLDTAALPWMRVLAERAWDASGREVHVQWELSGDSAVRLAIPEEAAWPVLVDPSWQAGDTMTIVRVGQTSTLLSDGRVLIAGGITLPAFFDALESAEIYDPRTGDFTATGSMAKGRWFHTATLLPNGKVLIIGGLDYDNANLSFVSTADLWDPATGEFTVVASLADARAYHTATLLKNGKVLVAGGANINGVLSSAEIFDPATNQFTATSSPLKTKRDFAAATLLPDGRVLVSGGEDGVVNLSSAEIFDPATNGFTDAGAMTVARRRHSMTLLRSGLVLVSGGRGPSGMLSSQELFDPLTNSFTATGPLLGPRGWHTATLMPTGQVLFVGGEDGTNRILAAESYDPATATNSPAGSMTVERDEPSAVLLASGQVLVVGGGVNALAEVFDPLGGGTAGAVAGTSPMGAARASFTATRLASGKILIAGGSNPSGTPLATAEVFDPSTGAFVATGAMSAARVRHAATLLPSGKVLVTGGQGSTGINASAELYDPDAGGGTGAFQSIGSSMSSGRSSHTSTLLATGQVLVAGGISGGTSGLATADLFDPPTATFVKLPNLTVARAGHTATLLPTGDVLLIGSLQGTSAERYHPGPDGKGSFVSTGLPSQARVTHTATLLPSGKVLICGGLDPSLPISSCELYDAAGGNGAGTFSPAASLSIGRGGHMAVLLPSGKVLVAGGCTSLDCTTRTATAELFDPTAAGGAGVFTSTTSLSEPRDGGAAALLPSGDVLLGGGATMTAFATATADRWSDGAAVAAAWRPVVSSAPTPTPAGVPVTITGSGLVGTSEGSSGRTGATANNRPIAIWMPAAGGMSMGPIAAPAANSATWTPAASALVGPGWLHVVVSGIIGPGRFVTLSQAPISVGCSVAAQCATNACVDGFCCQEACDAPCLACSAAKKVSGTQDGLCGPIAAGTDPEDECGVQVPSTCGTTGVCDGTGKCALHPAGTTCAPASCSGVILSNSYACDGDGICTATPVLNCSPFLCSDPANGAAACTTTCATTSDCAPGAFCQSNVCKGPQPNGAPCTSPDECQSLQCIDGICCNSDCAGTCLACSSAKKASGPDGICGPVANGQDPHDDCDEQDPLSCGLDGQCNGAGSCRLFSATTPCGATTCEDDKDDNGAHSKQGGQFCDGFGTCTVANGLDCDLYRCVDQTCGTTCTVPSANPKGDCIVTAYCNEASGTCEQKHPNGDPCENDEQCGSGFCVDGLCCNTECAEQCRACDVPGNHGLCTLVNGQPHGSRPACDSVGEECGGSCDGAALKCSYPGLTSPCGQTTCADGVAHPQHCDGKGSCGEPTDVDCIQYACGDEGCKKSCATNADCNALFRCEGDKCVPRTDTRCDGDHTLVGADGQRLDCSPYRCNAANVCLADCASSAECVVGSQCSADSKCTTPALPRVPDASCGCRVVGATGSSRWSAAAMALLAAAALLRARRRRRIEDRC